MKKASSRPRKSGAVGAQSITLRLQRSKIGRLDALAEDKGTSRSALIQLAVAEYLEKEEKK